jgi:hypothetical protein
MSCRTIRGGLATGGPTRFLEMRQARRLYARPLLPATVPRLPPPVTQDQLPPSPTDSQTAHVFADQLSPSGPVPLSPGRLQAHLESPPPPWASPLSDEEQAGERHRRLVNALADRRIRWPDMTVGDLDHLHEQLGTMDTGKLWRLYEALQEQHRGEGGVHGAEVVRRHLHQRDPTGEHPLTPETERHAWGLDADSLEPDEARRLASLIRSLPRVAGVPGSRGVPGAVYAPAGVNLGAILREPFPSLGVWPISLAQTRQAYGMPVGDGPRRHARGPAPWVAALAEAEGWWFPWR